MQIADSIIYFYCVLSPPPSSLSSCLSPVRCFPYYAIYILIPLPLFILLLSPVSSSLFYSLLLFFLPISLSPHFYFHPLPLPFFYSLFSLFSSISSLLIPSPISPRLSFHPFSSSPFFIFPSLLAFLFTAFSSPFPFRLSSLHFPFRLSFLHFPFGSLSSFPLLLTYLFISILLSPLHFPLSSSFLYSFPL